MEESTQKKVGFDQAKKEKYTKYAVMALVALAFTTVGFAGGVRFQRHKEVANVLDVKRAAVVGRLDDGRPPMPQGMRQQRPERGGQRMMDRGDMMQYDQELPQ